MKIETNFLKLVITQLKCDSDKKASVFFEYSEYLLIFTVALIWAELWGGEFEKTRNFLDMAKYNKYRKTH